MIIDVTGAGSYHGFLPVLVRTCIMTLTSTHIDTAGSQFPLPLATALFSFLYHLASYEAGGEALVSCGMMEGLLRVINWPGTELEHVTVSTEFSCPQICIYLQFYTVIAQTLAHDCLGSFPVMCVWNLWWMQWK